MATYAELKQPLVLDANHPLYAKLRYAIAPQSGAIKEVKTGTIASVDTARGPAPTYASDAGGYHAVYVGGNSSTNAYFSTTQLPSFPTDFTVDPFSVVSVGDADHSAGTYSGTILSLRSRVADARGWSFTANGYDDTGYLSFGGSGITTDPGTPRITAQGNAVQGVTVGSAGALTFFDAAGSASVDGTHANAPNLADNTTSIGVGVHMLNNNVKTSYNGKYRLALVFDELSATEMQSVIADPWAVFEVDSATPTVGPIASLTQFARDVVIPIANFGGPITSIMINAVDHTDLISSQTGTEVVLEYIRGVAEASGQYAVVVSDGTDTATLSGVQVDITHPYRVPYGAVDSSSPFAGVTVVDDPLAPARFRITTQPANGTLDLTDITKYPHHVDSSKGGIYTPNAGYTGSDSFVIEIHDPEEAVPANRTQSYTVTLDIQEGVVVTVRNHRFFRSIKRRIQSRVERRIQ